MLFGKRGTQEFSKLDLEMNVLLLMILHFMLEIGLVLSVVSSNPKKIYGFRDHEA
jgi:hypothetical protein